jgi:hypothetical protein
MLSAQGFRGGGKANEPPIVSTLRDRCNLRRSVRYRRPGQRMCSLGEQRTTRHIGFHSRLSALISAFAMRHNLSYGQSRQIFASEIASVELVPYHSKTFAFPAKLLTKLRSVQLVQNFVTDVLSPRARRGDCLIVVTRSSRYWGLKAARNIVLYEGSETRSAHLSPGSRGGDAILRFLQPGYRSRAA